MANKGWNKTNVFTLCLALAFSIIAFCENPVVSSQTTVKSSAEQRSRRIAEHQEIRRSAMELTQDLRAIHLTPQQRQEIHQLLKRYLTRTGNSRLDPNNENAAQSSSQASASAAPPQAAARLRNRGNSALNI